MESSNQKTAGQKRRVTVKLTHPNPLFEKWLTEWKNEAETKDSNLKYSFQHALKSLQKYPIPLESGKECAILKGFGTRICQMIDQRLREYRTNKNNKDDIQIENEEISKPKRSRKSKDTTPVKVSKSTSSGINYMPRPGSGGYAILLGLLTKEQESTYPGFVFKTDLITSAQHYCDKSMTVAEPGTRYTAWSSMKTLLEKDLVRKRGNPAKFSLTDDGRNIAINLHADITNEDDEIVAANPLDNQFLLPTKIYNSLEDEQNSYNFPNSFPSSKNVSKSEEKCETICSQSSKKSSPETFKKPLATYNSLEIEENSYNFPNSFPSRKNISKLGEKCETITKPLDFETYNVSPSKNTSPESFKKHLEVDSCEIISLDEDDDDDNNSPESIQNKSSSVNENHIPSEYIPDTGSNEYILLRKILLKSQDYSNTGFLLKSDYNNSLENISSMEILLKNGLIEEDFNKITITDKGLNVAINLLTTIETINRPITPKLETNEEIIEGILNSPLFKNQSRVYNFNLDNINEDYDLPINSPPKSPSKYPENLENHNYDLPSINSPLNSKSKSPESSNKIETIDLDDDIIIMENPIFSKIKNKLSDIETKSKEINDLPINSPPKRKYSTETIDLDDDIIISENPIFSKIKNKFSNNETKINNVETRNSNKNTILSDIFKSKEMKLNKKDMLTEKNSPKKDTRTNFDDIIFQSSRFEIILLVDTQETVGIKKSNLNDVTQHELNRHGIKFEIRRLSVGDFAWIARNNLNQELILPYILERKRMDDLSSSIKDGRFHEQKFRLKHCGIQNLMYLVETYGSKDHLGLPFNTLLQAATNTQVQENFIVKFTECHKHSIAYISTFTKQLIQIFKDKTLTGCSKESLIDSDITDQIIPLMTFSEFNKASTKNKNIKVRELFIRQLLQIKGVSFEKAMAITEKYPSPLRLRIAYMKNPDYVGEKLLSSIQYSKMNRFIGPAISKSIYQLYTKKLL